MQPQGESLVQKNLSPTWCENFWFHISAVAPTESASMGVLIHAKCSHYMRISSNQEGSEEWPQRQQVRTLKRGLWGNCVPSGAAVLGTTGVHMFGRYVSVFSCKKGNSSAYWVFCFPFLEESRCIKSVSKREAPQGLNSSVESIWFIAKPVYFLQVKNTLSILKFKK